jgi:MFS family permease
MRLARLPGNRAMLPVGLAIALSLFGDLTLFAVLVTQLSTLHITLAETGILLSVHRLVRIPCNPLSGWIQDRVGRRVPFLVGLGLAVASTAAYGLTSGFWPFLAARVGWGMAWSLINVAGISMTLDLSSPSDRGKLTGIYNTWVWVGYAVGPVVGSLLADAINFRISMLVCASITAIGLGAALLLLPETRRTVAHPARGAQFALSDPPENGDEGQRGFVTRAMFVYASNQFAVDGVILSTVTLLITRKLGESFQLGSFLIGAASTGGLILAVRSVLAAFISPWIGRLADGRRGRMPVLLAGLGAGAGSFILLALSSAVFEGKAIVTAVIVAGVIVGAVSASIVLVVMPALVGDHTPSHKRGRVIGQLVAGGDVGSTMGPFLALSAAPLLGLHWIYLLCAALFAVGWVMLSRMDGAQFPQKRG